MATTEGISMIWLQQGSHNYVFKCYEDILNHSFAFMTVIDGKREVEWYGWEE